MPRRLPAIDYPTDYLVRRVRHNGEIKWRGHLLYTTAVLAREPIGLKPIGEDCYELYFAHVPLAILDDRLQQIIRPV